MLGAVFVAVNSDWMPDPGIFGVFSFILAMLGLMVWPRQAEPVKVRPHWTFVVGEGAHAISFRSFNPEQVNRIAKRLSDTLSQR